MFASRIERVDARGRCPHIVADLDAVVVVTQNLVHRPPKIVEEPNPVDPDQKENNQSRQKAKREL